jgi:hypothetical protein
MSLRLEYTEVYASHAVDLGNPISSVCLRDAFALTRDGDYNSSDGLSSG